MKIYPAALGMAAVGIVLFAVPAAAQPILIPLQPQRRTEPPPPPPSPVPVAPPQATARSPADPATGQGAGDAAPGNGPASQTGAVGDPAARTVPE